MDIRISKSIKIVTVIGVVLCLFVGLLCPFASGVDSDPVAVIATPEQIKAAFQAASVFGGLELNPAYGLILDFSLDHLEYMELYDGSWLVDPNIDCGYGLDSEGNLIYRENICHPSGGGSAPSMHKQGHGGRVRSADDLIVSGSTFNNAADDYNSRYGPKNVSPKDRTSWQTRKYQTNKAFISGANLQLDFFVSGDGFCGYSGQVWMMPFYYIDGVYYYADKEYHVYLDKAEGNDSYNYDYISVDVYSLDMTGGADKVFSKENLISWDKNSSYLRCGFSDKQFSLYKYDGDFNYYLTYTSRGQLSFNFPTGVVNNFFNSTMTDKLNTNISYQNSNAGYCKADSTGQACEGTNDFGFFISDEFIETSVRPINVPDNYYITINGDTIYDYSVHNPDYPDYSFPVGDFGDDYDPFLYDLPDLPDDEENGGSSSGGSTSGNVIVGGNVNVGGSIDVGGQFDININVNQPSGGNSSDDFWQTWEAPSISEDITMEHWYDWLLESTDSIRGFLEKFFDFVPPWCLSILGVTIAGICVARFLGR